MRYLEDQVARDLKVWAIRTREKYYSEIPKQRKQNNKIQDMKFRQMKVTSSLNNTCWIEFLTAYYVLDNLTVFCAADSVSVFFSFNFISVFFPSHSLMFVIFSSLTICCIYDWEVTELDLITCLPSFRLWSMLDLQGSPPIIKGNPKQCMGKEDTSQLFNLING